MNTTDRAFLAAYQRRAGAERPAVAEPATALHFAPPRAFQQHEATPAARPQTANRAPLSRLIGWSADGPPAAQPAPIRPAFELASILWPTDATDLARRAERGLLSIIDRLVARPTPAAVLVGDDRQAGVTTTLLALAFAATRAGIATTVLDAAARPAIAALLGVRRARTLAECESAGQGPEAAAIASADDRLCLLQAGSAPTADYITRAIGRLAATHDLVLVDAGPVAGLRGDDPARLTDAAAWSALPGAAAMLLSRALGPAGDARRRAAAVGLLVGAGAELLGVVETMADP